LWDKGWGRCRAEAGAVVTMVDEEEEAEDGGKICGEGSEGDRADWVRLATSLSYDVRLEAAESPA